MNEPAAASDSRLVWRRIATAAEGELHTKARKMLFWGAILVLMLASIPLRHDATPDVSWLITMCERMLRGELAYIDIWETTPPVPMLLYMPAVLFGRLTGVRLETATFTFAYAAALFSLWLSARALPEYVADGGQSKWLVLLPAAVMLFIVPNDVFAQREYFAAAFALPMAAVFVRHAREGAWPPLSVRIFASALGALSIAIKPPLFALPAIVLATYYAAKTRSLSFLIISGILAAGLIAATITVISFLVYPAYLENIVPLMRDVYVPVRSSWYSFVDDKACIATLFCIFLTFILTGWDDVNNSTMIVLTVGIGFLLCYLVQGKYFYYHIYPAAMFVAISSFILIYERVRKFTTGRPILLARALAVYALAVFVVCGLFFIGFENNRPRMADLSWAAGLDQPRALALSPDIATSFPLARRIGAVWVDRIHSQWVARYTRFALLIGDLTELEQSKLAAYHRRDLEWILRQIKLKAPDIIIEDIRPDYSWLAAELASLEPEYLSGYKIIAEDGPIRVLRRK